MAEATPAAPAAPKDMLDEMKSRVAAKLQTGDTLKAIDPTMWVGLLSAVVEMIMECRKKRDAATVAAAMKSPNMVQKLRLRRGLVKQIGRQKLRAIEDPVVDSVLEVAKDATPNELTALVTQIDNG